MEINKIKTILEEKGWNDDILKLTKMLKDIKDVCNQSEKELIEEFNLRTSFHHKEIFYKIIKDRHSDGGQCKYCLKELDSYNKDTKENKK